MRARQEVYARASILQVVQIVVALAIPLVCGLVGVLIPAWSAEVAVISISMLVLDVLVIENLLRNQIRLAARISEQFDTAVLEIPENRLLAGPPVDPETIEEASSAYQKRTGKDDDILDWYPTTIADAPMHLARLICQRSNIRYDAALRATFGCLSLGVAGVLVFLFVAVGVWAGLSTSSLVAQVVSPSAPILVWTLREYLRQNEAAKSQTDLKLAIEELWDRVTLGRCSSEQCIAEARSFQDSIFHRRSSNPLILPGVYQNQRAKLEAQMNMGAAELWVAAQARLEKAERDAPKDGGDPASAS